MKYFDELCRAMEWLARDPRVMFLGQAVGCPGTAMTNTLKNVSRDKLLELPVAEEMQMGMANGLALAGQVPVSIFPRWNFLLLAVNQVGNHLDKFRLMCQNIEVIRLDEPQDIFPAYQRALEREDGKSTIVVEYGDYYNEK